MVETIQDSRLSWVTDSSSSISGLPSELQALILSARTSLTDPELELLVSVLSNPFNWEQFCQLATYHRVQPLVVATLQRVDLGLVPLSYQDALRQTAQRNAHRSLILTGALVSLIQAFEAESLPVLAYKGPVLATMIYGNLSLRRFNDLDLWIEERDHDQAEEILRQHGFEIYKQLSWETEWVNPKSLVYVDLHLRLTPNFFPLDLEFNSVYSRSQQISLAGTSIQTLCPEDNLILLCVNLARDNWEKSAKLLQLCDIAELLRSCLNLDEPLVLQQATRSGCRRMVLVGVALAQKLLNAPVGEILQQAIASDRQIESLTLQISQRLLSPDPNLPKVGSRIGFYWQIRERLREKILYLVTPNEDDRNHLDLKTKSTWIYYAVRPLRLVMKGLQRLRG